MFSMCEATLMLVGTASQLREGFAELGLMLGWVCAWVKGLFVRV